MAMTRPRLSSSTTVWMIVLEEAIWLIIPKLAKAMEKAASGRLRESDKAIRPVPKIKPVKGSASRRVLVRGVGPALAKFGVTGVLETPTLTVFQGDRLVAQNDGWQASAAEVTAASAASGAFALEAGSKDAAVVLTLAPGSYSAVVSGAGGLSGAALVEVYELAAGV